MQKKVMSHPLPPVPARGVNRREFIKGGMAGVLLGLTVGMTDANAFASAAAANVATNATVHAIYDDRFALARLFQSRLALYGARRYAISGDVTGLWTMTLEPHLRASPGIFVGLTTPSSLFGLEQLMSSYRMHLAVRMDVDESGANMGQPDIPQAFSKIVASLRKHELTETVQFDDVHTSRKLRGESDCLVAWVMRPTRAEPGVPV